MTVHSNHPDEQRQAAIFHRDGKFPYMHLFFIL